MLVSFAVLEVIGYLRTTLSTGTGSAADAITNTDRNSNSDEDTPRVTVDNLLVSTTAITIGQVGRHKRGQ